VFLLPTMTSTKADFRFDLPRHTKVLLVLDVVESVRLMEGDEHGFVQRWQQLRERTKQLLQLHGGRMVKSLGDGLMLEFNHVTGCVRTAFALQDFCAAGNAQLKPEHKMHLRMGIHVADFVSDEQDIYGTDVNLTARIATLAGPGEIVVTPEVRDGLTAGLDAEVEDLGECHLKHVDQPIRAYRVGPPGHAPVIQPGNTVRLDLRPTVAVIPFASRGMDVQHALIGEAVADELIAALSRTAELHVISRLSTTAFGNRTQDGDALEDIRQHLGASYVLSGRCTVIGQQVNLFVELAEVTGGRIVWADNIKGTLGGLFNAQDEALSRVVSAVSSAVMKHELQRAQNHSLPTLDGYTLLLSAVALMHRNDFQNFDRAREMLEHLAERAKRHPVPHAWLAKWHVLSVTQGWAERDKAAALATDCTKRALDAEPANALALTIDGFVHTNLLKDTESANDRYAAALDANPNESLAWLLRGVMHAFRGEGAFAVDSTSHAIRLSPLDPLRYFYDSLAATAANANRDFSEAVRLSKRSLSANRMHTSTWRTLIVAHVELGQMELAQLAAKRLLQLEPDLTVTGFLKRSASADFWTGSEWAKALEAAGLPK
jgi:adenylate cyclase